MSDPKIPQAAPPAANLIWRGPGDPPEFVTIGPRTIIIPPGAAKGVYCESAPLLVDCVAGFKLLNPGAPSPVGKESA